MRKLEEKAGSPPEYVLNAADAEVSLLAFTSIQPRSVGEAHGGPPPPLL